MEDNAMSIELKNGVIHYYGNKAGYVEDDRAVVDTMFTTPELAGWLSERKLEPEWCDGIYDRLMSAPNSDAPELKNLRIWQLKADSDPMMKFVSYDTYTKEFGEPSRNDYETVYDGKPGTNNLNEIFEMFNISRPEGFAGHSLSMSDVVEFYDDDGGGSECYYVDRFGFKEIDFGGQTQTQSEYGVLGGMQ
jgi:hypothetical protein